MNQALNMNSRRYLGAGLILAALLPLSNGSRILSAQNEFVQASSVHNATVIDHVLKAPARAETVNSEVFSVVEFVDDNGNRRKATTNISSYPAPNAIGEEISVRVHRTQPDDVRVVSFAGLWLESSFYLVPGILTLAIGILLIMRKRTKA